MKRRNFLKGALASSAAVAAASSFPAPAISQGRMEWKMVTSWPRGLGGLHTGAERFAQRIGEMTDGRLTIKVFAGGELVPALQCFDAVAGGTAEIGHDAPYYHLSKSPAMAFYSTVPFGLTATEMAAWMHFGGGQQLFEKLMARFGLKAYHGGNTGHQLAGWFRKEIKSVDDLKGLKFRMPGQGGLAMQKLGVNVVNLPGGEVFQALQSGALDGTEWVGPYNDLALGFYKVAPFYYYPGFHEPGTALQVMFNKAKLEALPKDLQAILKYCCHAENDTMLAEFNARSGPALRELVTKHQVKLRKVPNEVVIAFGNASGEVLQEVIDKGDDITKEVARSFLAFRQEQINYNRITDEAYTIARRLRFKYPTKA
ncbi:MAG: TRAP transporter substrate-binding protein DctP [Alphaproteobacteria bacterium]|nr:TRAP transporter substrate-binding protein DctP [Alphaproteobacteria bacterium]